MGCYAATHSQQNISALVELKILALAVASKASLDGYFEPVQYWFAITETDKDRSTHRGPSCVPRFVGYFFLENTMPFTSLVQRQDAFRFGLVRRFNLYWDIGHGPILSRSCSVSRLAGDKHRHAMSARC